MDNLQKNVDIIIKAVEAVRKDLIYAPSAREALLVIAHHLTKVNELHDKRVTELLNANTNLVGQRRYLQTLLDAHIKGDEISVPRELYDIAMGAVEINENNYDHDQVCDLNNAMINLCAILYTREYPKENERFKTISTCINDIRGLLEDPEGYPSFKGSDADHNVYQNAMGILLAELGIEATNVTKS